MRYIVLAIFVLAGCGSANRTDGVTPSEAAGLNKAADKLDTPSSGEAAPEVR